MSDVNPNVVIVHRCPHLVSFGGSAVQLVNCGICGPLVATEALEDVFVAGGLVPVVEIGEM